MLSHIAMLRDCVDSGFDRKILLTVNSIRLLRFHFVQYNITINISVETESIFLAPMNHVAEELRVS